jgi:hypothetical protein
MLTLKNYLFLQTQYPENNMANLPILLKTYEKAKYVSFVNWVLCPHLSNNSSEHYVSLVFKM